MDHLETFVPPSIMGSGGSVPTGDRGDPAMAALNSMRKLLLLLLLVCYSVCVCLTISLL